METKVKTNKWQTNLFVHNVGVGGNDVHDQVTHETLSIGHCC